MDGWLAATAAYEGFSPYGPLFTIAFILAGPYDVSFRGFGGYAAS